MDLQYHSRKSSTNAGSDRQDIELDESMFVPLITKNPSILWVSVRENDIVAAAYKQSSKRTKKHHNLWLQWTGRIL
jgi:hypothetical protein